VTSTDEIDPLTLLRRRRFPIPGGHCSLGPMNSFVTEPSDQWRHPAGRLLTMRTAEVGLVSLLVAISSGLLGLISGFRLAIALFVVMIIAGLIWMMLERRRVRSWAYCERDEELLVQRGLLNRRLSVVPYGRMQFIDVTAGPAERLFDLATVQLHTAAAATDARIPGLLPEEAQRLRDQLTRLGESRLSGL
jgi:uncharacterized protein